MKLQAFKLLFSKKLQTECMKTFKNILFCLLLWRYSRPAWTRSSTTYCRWPCFGREVGLDDPQRSLPTPNILWFCEKSSVFTQNFADNPNVPSSVIEVSYCDSSVKHLQSQCYRLWKRETKAWTQTLFFRRASIACGRQNLLLTFSVRALHLWGHAL